MTARILVIVGLLTGVAVSAILGQSRSQAQPASPEVRFQLVGFTTASLSGRDGVLAFTAACQAEFEAAARMCSSREVLETTTIPDGLSGRAWVRPSFEPVGLAFEPVELEDASLLVAMLDASGVSTVSTSSISSGMSCRGWSTGDSGLSVDANGRFGLLKCVERHVACCAPVR